jgi:hypothetical protein
MTITYWTDYAGYLTTALSEYEEIVCQVTEDIGRIIWTFGFILFHTDLLALSMPDAPDPQASWTGVEVKRLALDTITRAASIRDSMQHVQQETQGGLIKAKKVIEAVEGGRVSSTAEIEGIVQEISEIGEVLQQVSAITDDLIPAAMDMLDVAKVLQKKVGMLAVGSVSEYLDQTNPRKDSGRHRVTSATGEGRRFDRNRDTYRLISLARHKYWEN